jgi:glucose-6-phosphate isomerase
MLYPTILQRFRQIERLPRILGFLQTASLALRIGSEGGTAYGALLGSQWHAPSERITSEVCCRELGKWTGTFKKQAASNLPLVAALIGVWYVEYLKFPTYAVLPYAQDLDRFPAYLQQADMESNGKSMGRDGRRIKHHSGPVIWGEAGTNGQHAFYQLIHQGTTIHPADIIACVEPHSRFEKHHEKLLANAIAQAEALMIGKPLATVETELEARGFDAEMIQSSAPHRVFEGNRPTGFILMDRLDPHSLGQLIAWYEHRIFLQGLFWNVCSYDQWGVELGKQLAGQILKEWNGGEFLQHDASSAALMKHIALKRQD